MLCACLGSVQVLLYHQWLKENEDHLSVPKSTIEEILKSSNSPD